MRQAEPFVNLGHFCHLPPHNPKNQNFEKMKKAPGNIIVLHMSTNNHDHKMYASWDMERDRQIFFVILAHFLPFYPNMENQNFEKMKKKMLGDRFTQVHHKWKLYDTSPPSILKSKGMCSILLKKGKKGQKGAKYLKIWAKLDKIKKTKTINC